MKRFAILAAASAFALGVAAPAVAAPTLYYSTNGTTFTQATSTTFGNLTSFTGAAGNYTFNLSGSSETGLPDLNTTALTAEQTGGTGGTLYLFVVNTGFPAYSNPILSTFNSNQFSGSAVSATLTSAYNTTGAMTPSAFTTLATHTFTGPNTVYNSTSGLVTMGANGVDGIEYAITFGAGAGTFNGTANISAVPEAATWGMMILGFGMMGVALRSRKAKISFA